MAGLPDSAGTTVSVVRTVAALRRATGAWRRAGASIGLVPTMGALHDGHIALVEAARRAHDRVVVTIFVNPTQFGPSEDLAAYPRREAKDVAVLQRLGVDLAFVPEVAEMYPPGDVTTVSVANLTEGLCGAHRPGHFAGVATVVTKLLLQCLPDTAYFGEKDYQQLQMIRRLTKDLHIPVAIAGVPTVRAADGLALSSRNDYLDVEQRRIAAELNRVLRRVAEGVAAGKAPAALIEKGGRTLLEAGFTKVDYLELRDAETLAPASDAARPARVLAAAWIGPTRLIDNWPVTPSRAGGG